MTPVRLYCFPPAGGGALGFRAWPARLPAWVEARPVVWPGREARSRERPHTRMDPLVEQVAAELLGELAGPFAFFGHSLGAAVAYELCRRYFPAGGGPAHLFVSGRRAPHLPAREPPAHGLARAEFLDRLRRLNGIPEEVLADPALMDAFLPALRADFEVNEGYAPPPGPALPIPVSGFVGDADPAVPVADMLDWRRVTARGFRLRVFSGDHFYLGGGRADLLAAVCRDLTRSLAATAPTS